MSNKLKPKKKHKEPDFTWTKSEKVTLKNSNNRRKLVRRSFTDFMDLGYYVLYLHHGFGNKRIVRLERTINEYLERAQTENEMKIETLRDMGDEELADILFDSCIDHIEVSSCERMFEKDSCKECVLNWLQSEAE